jgi:hypothetical protein
MGTVMTKPRGTTRLMHSQRLIDLDVAVLPVRERE